MIRAVLLDIDGTLIDSNDAHARAWVDAFAEFGRTVPFERVRPLIGKGGDKLMPEVSGLDSESGEGKRISERRAALFRERYLPTIKPFPRATELLERLRADGINLVVATSAKKDELEPLLAICDASRLISARTSSDDAENSKPDGRPRSPLPTRSCSATRRTTSKLPRGPASARWPCARAAGTTPHWRGRAPSTPT
jgi:phosphoglycolate phosphatase-like HAD superfamily hydrolase